MSNQYQSDVYLSWAEVQRITGNKSRTTIWRWMRDGHFPKTRRIGPNSVSWLASEIQKWVDSKEGEVIHSVINKSKDDQI